MLSVADRSTSRIALLLIPTTLVALIIAQTLNPIFVPFFATPLANHIAKELDPQALSNIEFMRVIRRYNLAWCYLTDSANSKVIDSTSAFSPRSRSVPIPETSKPLTVRDESFYEAVVPYNDKMNLHVGLAFAPTFPNLTSFNALFSLLYTPLYMGSILLIFLVLWTAIFILLESLVGRSIRAVGNLIDMLSALIKENYTYQKVDEATRLAWTPSDFRALGHGLNILMDRVSELKESMRDKQKEREQGGTDTAKNRAAKKALQATELRQALTGNHDLISAESGVFAVKFDKEFRAVGSSYEFAVMLLDGIHELYSDTIDAAAFLKVEKNHLVVVESCLGLDDDSLELLNRIDHREFIDERNLSKKSIDVGPMLIKKLGFEPLATKDQFGRVIYLPLAFDGRAFALLACFINQGHIPTPDRIRSLERFRDQAIGAYSEHRIREEKDDDRWNDPATGMGNKIYFNELMPKIVERCKGKHSEGYFSILMIQPDFTTPRLARFPAEMHDRWFAEIGKLITGLLPISKRIIPEKGATNYLIRYQEHVMAVVLEGINGNAAINVAEGIRNSVISKSQWSGGATDLSVSVGVANFPRDSDNAEQMVIKASLTLSYVKDKLGGNAVCDSQKVPPDYRPREATEIQGTLGVLDNVGLLQSIATTEKSGVLIVSNDNGQKFVITWFEGSPKNASLGDLAGIDALIEFITTFKNGSYTFQARSMDEDQKSGTLRSLERCLMEAALAEDKMIAALRVIPTPDRLVRGVENPAGWDMVSKADDVDPDEINAMKEVLVHADGTKTLSNIFSKLALPTSKKWRAAALLLQYQLMQMKMD